jgi:hypothetical protein
MSDQNQVTDIGFLDFLYILAIGIGLAPGFLGIPGGAGLLSEEWVRTGGLPSGDARFNLGVFLLGLLTISFSWFGYHRSLSSRPYKYDNLLSMFRFVLDVFLLVLYGVLLLQFRNFTSFLFLLALNYLGYLTWDMLKVVEFKEVLFKKREIATLIAFVALVVLWLLSGRLDRGILLAAAFIVTISYRMSKIFIRVPKRAS